MHSDSFKSESNEVSKSKRQKWTACQAIDTRQLWDETGRKAMQWFILCVNLAWQWCSVIWSNACLDIAVINI